MSDSQTEIVYAWNPDGESGWVAYDNWLDVVAEIDAWSEDDIEGPVGTIKVERKPVGYVASLPEFERW